MTETFLDKAYGTSGIDATRKLYREWAQSYDFELRENGYVTPGRCATALKAVTVDFSKPILDFGCGSGLSGLALVSAGFQVIDGIDLTQEMLDLAAKKDLYRSLALSDVDVEDRVKRGNYSAIAAIGVIGAGAAPVEVLDMLLNALGPGGKFVFSFNDHTLNDPIFTKRVEDAVRDKSVQVLSEEYGDHILGHHMKSKVYVLEKT